jgi:hypothetical protein
MLFRRVSNLAIVQAVSRRPLTVDGRVRSQASPHEICGGQSGTGASLSLSNSGFFLSVSFYQVPYKSYSSQFSYQKDKRTKSVNCQTKECSVGYRGARKKKLLLGKWKRPSITTAVVIWQYLLSNYVLHVSACRNHNQAPTLKITNRKMLKNNRLLYRNN